MWGKESERMKESGLLIRNTVTAQERANKRIVNTIIVEGLVSDDKIDAQVSDTIRKVSDTIARLVTL